MYGTDIVVSTVLSALARANVLHFPLNHFYPLHGIAALHSAAMIGYHTGQQVGRMLRTTYKTAGAVDVEHADDGMDVGGGLTSTTSVQGVHIGQYAAQMRVAHILSDESIGCQ